MEITTFACKHCGAAIDIPAVPSMVACAYCGSGHEVYFHDGSISADLIEKVKRIDEDIARLKGTARDRTIPPGPKERLKIIEQGKLKWHRYISAVTAGQHKDSPEMIAILKEAHEDLLSGYGPGNGPLVNDAYNSDLAYVDIPTSYLCFYIMFGLIILAAVFGTIEVYNGRMRSGVLILAVGFMLIVAGIPFFITDIRRDKAHIAKRKEAIARLDRIEQDIRRRAGVTGNPSGR